MPHAFLDLDVWSAEGEAAEIFRSTFTHPVIQFSDRIFLHKNRNVVHHFVLSQALATYCRQLMTVGNLPVQLPVRFGRHELADYEHFLAEHIAETTGLTDPKGDVGRRSRRDRP